MDYLDWGSRTIEKGSSVFIGAWLWGAVIEEGKRKGGKFYRSKEKKDLNRPPFGSYMMNKKWTLEEEFNNHMLMFQQVKGSCIFYTELHFDITGWITGQ